MGATGVTLNPSLLIRMQLTICCSTGEGDDLGSHLFSDKTLNALMGAQMQQVAEEEQQQVRERWGDSAVVDT